MYRSFFQASGQAVPFLRPQNKHRFLTPPVFPPDSIYNFLFGSFRQLQTANLLFIDSPVGSGFSYVEDDSTLTTNMDGISADLLTLMKDFMEKHPDFEVNCPDGLVAIIMYFNTSL